MLTAKIQFTINLQFNVTRSNDELPTVNANVCKDSLIKVDRLGVENAASLDPQLLVDGQLAILHQTHIREANDCLFSC